MASKLSLRRAQVNVPDSCVLCDCTQDVNWYCNDCQEALCDKCKDGHQRGKKTRTDDVVPIKEANKRDGEVVLPEVCTTHPGKSCDLFCTECHVVMCSMCLTQKHKQHAFKHLEEKIHSQKQLMRDKLKTLKSNLDYFTDKLSKRHEVSKSFKKSANVLRETVLTQRSKLKAEIDTLVDSVLDELSALVEEEEKSHHQDSLSHKRNVKEMEELIKDVEQMTEQMSSTSLFDHVLTGKLRTIIPLNDVVTKTALPRLPHFVSGKLDPDQLKKMMGYIQVNNLESEGIGYEKKEIDSREVQHISTFRVPQKTEINSLCSIDDNHAWLSVLTSNELIMVNKKGKVMESVKIDFGPWYLAVTNTKELLITHREVSPLIHKLSKDRRVTRFADISPLQASGITVSDSDEVFVTTHSPTIQVLNMSGERIRQLSCERDGLSIVCLSTGHIVVTAGSALYTCGEMISINKSDQIIHRWSGELDNGQTLSQTIQCSIARDRYDRVFVPDLNTGQVYVLSGDEKKAKCLLDSTLGIVGQTAVCVDKCGHVWIGCNGGTVHVIQL